MRDTDEIDRRTFLKGAGGMLMASSMEARSYARILGANDRIRLAQLGCGDRSEGRVGALSATEHLVIARFSGRYGGDEIILSITRKDLSN